MVGWHHWLDGHEFEQAPRVSDGQGSLVCCSPWGHKESNTTEWLLWIELIEEVFIGVSLGTWGNIHLCPAAAAAKSLQLCPTLCNPRDSSPPGKNTGVGCHFRLQCVKVKLLSRVWLFANPWTAAYQAPPSMEFSRQEYWSGLPLPSPPLSNYSMSFMSSGLTSQLQGSLVTLKNLIHWI